MATGNDPAEQDDYEENRTVKKFEIEAALKAEHEDIKAGRLKEDNPLELSEGFGQLCEASRRGDLKVCQEKILEGVNLNARDLFDYTPLILASLCGHYEVVRLLLEAGALCERDTFQGERALYNALTDKIRNLLLSYDYSKSRDPLQPLAGHITSLLQRDVPSTSDIVLCTDDRDFYLHKFILSARSPYFAKKLSAAPETASWKVPPSVPTRALQVAIEALYFGEVSLELTGSFDDQAILAGVQKLGRQLETGDLLETIFEADRRKARQKRTEEVDAGRTQLETWFRAKILGNQIRIDADRADSVRWDRQNSIFADVLLCANDDDEESDSTTSATRTPNAVSNGTGVGPLVFSDTPDGPSQQSQKKKTKATLMPAHRAMLIRSEYFLAMFSSPFREAQTPDHLPVIHVDCSPAVLAIVLSFLYTERCDMPLTLAVPTLFAADMLFIERLKVQAATIISTLGNGSISVVEPYNPVGEVHDAADEIDIYDVVRAGWDTRVPRLEEFGARFMAYRLERFIEETDFKDLVKESAARIRGRQETDTVELIDDIRYYLSERFRLRFEDAGIEDMVEHQVVEHRRDGNELANGSISPEVERPIDNNMPEGPAAELSTGMIRTLDGEIAGDEFAQDAINYQILLGKIDALLENLDLDA